MRRRKLLVAAGSVILAGSMVVGAPAAIANGDDFTLHGEFTDFDYDDNGRDGLSEGDEVSFEFDFDDDGDGDGLCEVTHLDRRDREFEADCEATFYLDDGDLDLEGTVDDGDFRDGEVTLDVVDGTGDYRNADGTATFEGRNGRDRRYRSHGDGHDGGHRGHHSKKFKVGVDLA